MYRVMCKSKIHQAKVTAKNLHYEGSIGIDGELMEQADIMPGELLQVVNLRNGQRFESYAIPEEKGSGTVCLNGGTARLGEVGDEILVLSYALVSDEDARGLPLKLVFVDENNRIVSVKRK
ncbi:MAG TPA: aspartate 1-decarboxylase [Candidatus Latescibacteria bacterium]|nr:aspartate 1-decarboxylase [Candidatus Latescibacterota bacterium]